MNLKPKKLILIAMAMLAMIFTTIFLTTCGNPASPEDENKATVVGCNLVSYKGVTYTITGCNQPGVASFNVTITQGGNTASFRITCSGGCIGSAVPI